MTRIFAAYNAVLATIEAAVDPDVVVFDGPQTTFPTVPKFVLVGVDDPLSTSMITAVDAGAQAWADLGAYVKEETFTVTSTLIVWSGATDLSLLRVQAEQIIDAIEAAVRPHARPFSAGLYDAGAYGTADLLNGADGALGPTGWADMAVTRLQHIQDQTGAALHVGFVIACTTQI